MDEEKQCTPLNDDNVKFITDRQNFDESTYKTLFNDFQLKGVDLKITSPKALVEMTDEELLAWVHLMDDFVRIAKVASTSSRVRLEDRKLQLTLEQRQAIEKLDRQYKPKTVKAEKEKKEKVVKEAKDAWADTPELKRVAATMKILDMTREEAETWIADQKK
jgi:hypothetical protein